MKSLHSILFVLICCQSAVSDEWVPKVIKENGRYTVHLLGMEESILLEHNVVVRSITRSTEGNDFILELNEETRDGGYNYGALVCEWDEDLFDWKVYYRMMNPDLILEFGTRTGLALVYDDFKSLDEVMVIIESMEHRESPAYVLRTWRLWNFRTDQEIRQLRDEEIHGGLPKLKESK